MNAENIVNIKKGFEINFTFIKVSNPRYLILMVNIISAASFSLLPEIRLQQLGKNIHRKVIRMR